MILDNKTGTVNRSGKKLVSISDYLTEYIGNGEMDIVSGYFTIGALSFLSKLVNDKTTKFRFIIGDLVKNQEKLTALDLLNQSVSIEDALKICDIANDAVNFLKQSSLEIKTLEPNFCHAKLYLHRAQEDPVRDSFFISGSSNLTEAGLGLKISSNLELNLASHSIDGDFEDVENWFADLWDSKEARQEITLEDGSKKDFKQYLIDEISRIFIKYTPEQIYFKILSELFADEINLEGNGAAIESLKETVIWKKLFDYQKVGVESLIRNIENYNGAVLADAVGLGKTWTGLAVMKAMQMKGYTTVLVGPKKLRQNWEQYKKNRNSVFEEDKLDFDYVNHTSLTPELLERDLDMSLDFLFNDKPKLIVVDESHNLRNKKSSRYKFLVEEVLRKIKGDVKVLLLSATPINNSFNDIRDQFALIAKGKNDGFYDHFGIRSLEHSFRGVNNAFKEWRESPVALPLYMLFEKIKDSDFMQLTNKLLVARTRKNIKEFFDANLILPKHKQVKNIFKTPIEFNTEISSLDDLMDRMEVGLMAYQPSFYTITKEQREQIEKEKEERKQKNEKGEKDAVLKDSVQREYFLVKMMKILMIKRLESSWDSFRATIKVFRDHHHSLIEKMNAFEEAVKNNPALNDVPIELLEKESMEMLMDLVDDDPNLDSFIGKKSPIHLMKIYVAGNFQEFKDSVSSDLEKLDSLLNDLEAFKVKIEGEHTLVSEDSKLQELMQILTDKKENNANKKCIIFTVYNDTAHYLYAELKKREFTKLGLISGSSFINYDGAPVSNMEEVLQRFAPFTKLYNEKNWEDFERACNITEKGIDNFSTWIEWVKTHHTDAHEKLENGIDILIATDVISEGQNLQDSDTVINYDIHWNPVRVIQRVGRVDRIGSPNAEIQAVNFWPAAGVDDYINLQKRVKDRMAAMRIAGSEIVNLDEDFKASVEVDELDEKQNNSILKQISDSYENADDEKTLGFDDFSFDNYRQAVEDKLKKDFENTYRNLPDGIFSGFLHTDLNQEGMIALLRSAVKHKKTKETIHHYKLIFINDKGEPISANQKTILDFLAVHHKAERFVTPSVENGDVNEIKMWKEAIETYLRSLQLNSQVDEEGNVTEFAGKDLVKAITSGLTSSKAKERIEAGEFSDEHLLPENQSLLAWMIVTNKQ